MKEISKKIKCHAFVDERCRSCSIINEEYEIGLNKKIDSLKKLFAEFKINSDHFNEVIETKNLNGYRNKAKFVIGGNLDAPIFGIPSPKDKYLVSPLLDCPIHPEKINQVAIEIKNRVKEFLLTPYDIATKKGEFKYLIITLSRKLEEISIRFGVRSSESRPRVEKLSKILLEKFPSIKVISFEIQPKHAAIFEGETFYITKEKYIKHDFDNFDLYSSTTNFFQVNSEVANNLYERVYQEYKERDISLTLDLFCGVGGFGISAKRFSKKVIGIELSQNAIDCANQTNLEGVSFICDDAIKFSQYNQDKVDLVIVNPPRRGIGERFCHMINELSPKYLTYSSCNADSLKKDAAILSTKYHLVKMIPVDMFALTDHIEVLTFWERQN